MRRKPRKGFTIIEALVVLGIILILIALLLPAVQHVRNVSYRARCASNLHQIHIGLEVFLLENEDGRIYPTASPMPSLAASPPGLNEILHPYTQSYEIFRCPLDDKYWKTEKQSYEYTPLVYGKTPADLERRFNRGLSYILLIFDYAPIHGPPGTNHSRNYLYADGHVSEFDITP